MGKKISLGQGSSTILALEILHKQRIWKGRRLTPFQTFGRFVH